MLVLFVLFAALLAWPTQESLAKEPAYEWILRQRAQDTGEHTVYISPDAVKIVCATEGFNILAKAPGWQVYCYRTAAKEVWIGNLDQFNGTIMINPFATPNIKTIFLDGVSKATYDGLKCTRYTCTKIGSPIILASDDIAASSKACEFICRYYYVPKITKVPLYRMVKVIPQNKSHARGQWLDADVIKDLRTGDRVVLETKAWQKVAFNATDFEYPKNYKRIKNINRIGYSSAKRHALGDMIDEIGFTTDMKKEAKKSKPKPKPKQP